MSELSERLEKLMGVNYTSYGEKITEEVKQASSHLKGDKEIVDNNDKRFFSVVEEDCKIIEAFLEANKPLAKMKPTFPDNVAKSFNDASFVRDDFFDKTVCNFILQFTGADQESARVLAITMAKKDGITGFAGMFKKYRDEIESHTYTEPVPFFFKDSPLQEEIDPGKWRTDGQEIWKEEDGKKKLACKHPILPIATLTNIDDKSVKTQLAYKRKNYWETVVVPNEVIASSFRIATTLSRLGISVTPSTAQNLSDYLDDISHKNDGIIPEKRSVGRLGWMGENLGFVPYTDQVIFDDETGFKDMLSAIRTDGTFEAWKEAANQLRTSTEMQIVLAASFASVLLNIIRCQPFFVHIWSALSGSGKTVSLKLAASVWADPDSGYIRNFSGTSVSFELTAAFLNHLPMIVDELQLSNQDGQKKRFDVYALAEGFGKSRGTKGLGVQYTRTWRNVIITSGESSITDGSSASGIINRIIDVEIKPYQNIIDEKTVGSICTTLAANFGHAGRKFVEAVYPIKDAVRHRYDELCETLRHGATGKQANAGAAIVLADELLNGFIFKTAPTLTVEKLSQYLASRNDADVASKAYTYMQGMLVQQSNCIEQAGGVSADRTLPRTIGRFADEDGYVYIVKPEFERILKEGGFDARAVISAMASSGRLRVTPGRLKERKYTIPHNVGAGRPQCYCFNLGKKSDTEEASENAATQANCQNSSENNQEDVELPF